MPRRGRGTDHVGAPVGTVGCGARDVVDGDRSEAGSLRSSHPAANRLQRCPIGAVRAGTLGEREGASGKDRRHAPSRCQCPRLHDPGDLLPGRSRDRRGRPDVGQDRHRLLPLRAVAARLDHRVGLRRRQPRRAGDPRHGGQRRPVRRRHRPLLLDRRRPGDGLPGHRDDALLLRRQGPLRAGVPAPALQRADARAQRRHLRRGHGAHRRRQPLRARAHRAPVARVVDLDRDHRRRASSSWPTSRSAG